MPKTPAQRNEARRHMARLHDLAGRLDHQAALIRNGGRDPRAEARAGKLGDEAFAIRWALRHLDVTAPQFDDPSGHRSAFAARGARG